MRSLLQTGISWLFLSNFPKCPKLRTIGIWLSVIDLILEIVASSCDSLTDFTLWASREGCPVTEYVNKLLLKMSPMSPLAPCRGNNGTMLMRENGEGVTGTSSPFFLVLRGRSYSFLCSMADQAYYFCPMVMEEWELKPCFRTPGLGNAP